MMTIRSNSIIALALLSGCSFAFTSGPPKRHEQLPAFDCTTNPGSVYLDGVLSVVSALLIVAVAFNDNPDQNLEVELGLRGGLLAAGIGGVIVGRRRVLACRDARQALYKRLARREKESALPESAAPSGGLVLASRDIEALEVLTKDLRPDSPTVLAASDATRVNQLSRELGKLYISNKLDGKTCALSTVRSTPIADSANLERASPTAEKRTLHLVKPASPTELSALAGVDLNVRRGDVALVEIRKVSRSLVDNNRLEAHLKSLTRSADVVDKCLFYIDRVTAYRLNIEIFRRETADGRTGVSGVNVAGHYYASDGSTQNSYRFLYDVKSFASDGTTDKLLRRSLTATEARAFEAALASPQQ